MKLWLFTFTDPACKVSSCRVRAAHRVEACALVEHLLKAIEQPMILVGLSPRPHETVLLCFLGMVPGDEAAIVSIIDRKGNFVENEAA